MHSRLELVERILPPGRVAEVIPLLQEAWAVQSASGPENALARAVELLRGEPANAEA